MPVYLLLFDAVAWALLACGGLPTHFMSLLTPYAALLPSLGGGVHTSCSLSLP